MHRYIFCDTGLLHIKGMSHLTGQSLIEAINHTRCPVSMRLILDVFRVVVMVEGLSLLRGSRTGKSLLDILQEVDHGVLCQGLGCFLLVEQVVDEAKGAHTEESPGKIVPNRVAPNSCCWLDPPYC